MGDAEVVEARPETEKRQGLAYAIAGLVVAVVAVAIAVYSLVALQSTKPT